MDTKHYLHDKEEVYRDVLSCEEGLSQAEAEVRLAKNGPNKLKEGKKKSVLARFFEQLANPMILVLLAAAAVNFVTVLIERAKGGEESFAECIIIVAVVLLNAVLGVVQESKAEEAIAALQEMTAATCKVLRDGALRTVKSREVVVGDVVILEAGDAVPADCRIVEAASLKIEEAALTGESVPSNKTAEKLAGLEIPLGDRKNMAYMGTTVVYGRGKAVVVGTGMETEMGKIADVLAKAEDDETPLQKKLASLSKILSFLVLGICVFIFAFKLIKEGDFHAEVVLESFIVAVSLAVAAIPEGLATVVTIVLSMGVTKMSKKNAVIRKLTAVETLGCTQIICSDKTGTLTQNKMTVVEHYGDDETLLARGMAQCSDAVLDENKQAKGEPTECALVNYAYKLGLDKGEMSVHKQGERIVQYTKGAPDEILKRCTAFWSGGREQPMTERKREEILARNKGMADRALRVLALAYRRLEEAPKDCEPASLEHDLVFVGLTGMIDPVRPEVKAAILECRSAGIRPIMITGDHIDTAAAIAKELGIISDASEATTGAAIGAMNDKEFAEKIEKYSVYARVQPEHKVRIVNGWRAKGKITAMTGDGVNDAPSIKSADIGVGMGIAGTDVTKNAADMVLADDNFATIVAAVGEGRRIYDNIRKAIQFLLSSNLSEVVAVFVATLFGFTLLRPMHLLWINLITDTFPALALGMEQGEDDLMRRAPRDSKEGIFAHGMGADIFLHGFYIAIITLLSYFLGHYIETGVWDWSIESADGMTMAFLTMSMMEIFHAFNVRLQRKSIFSTGRQNVWLWGAMAISLLLTAAVIYIPFLKNAFEFEAISAAEYAIAMALALSVIPFVELSKAIRRILEK